jgi:AGZA family xanthine/uracil permease-like MFS transporter
MIERLFGVRAAGSTVRTELVGGATTFVTLSYIIFVQPAVLAAAGMDPGAVLVATCVSSAFATLLMGLWANYPIAVAPAMGHNFYFAFTIAGPVAAGGMGYPWQVALGANCIAGIVFLFLSLVGLRERLVQVIPVSLQHAIAGGIGLLIAFLGLQWAGVVRAAPGTMVALGDLHHPVTLLALAGTLVTAALVARGHRGYRCCRPGVGPGAVLRRRRAAPVGGANAGAT